MRDLNFEQVEYNFPALSYTQKIRFLLAIRSAAWINRMRRNVKIAILISSIVSVTLILIAYKLQNPNVSFAVGLVVGILATWAFFAIIFRGFFD